MGQMSELDSAVRQAEAIKAASAEPAKPARIRLSRKKGFNLERSSRELNGLPAAKVARPSIFGNPFLIGDALDRYVRIGPEREGETPRQMVIRHFREWIEGARTAEGKTAPSIQTIKDHLRGHNLACWCGAGQACHADVLLEIANG